MSEHTGGTVDPMIVEANDNLQHYVSNYGVDLPVSLLHLIANVDWAIRGAQSGGGNPLPPMTIEEGRRSTQRWGMGE